MLALKWLTAGMACLTMNVAVAQGDTPQLRSWAAACAGCHGTRGAALPGMPVLAGAPREELAQKMLDFKAGRTPATIMHQLTRGYTDEQLMLLATYFAAQKP